MKRHISALVYACTLALLLLHVQDATSSEHEETLTHMYGPFDLAADTLQQVPPKMEFTFPEDMWLVGYSAEIVDASGNRLARELQCHTFLGAPMPLHHKHEQVVGLFSDGYTENLRLPEGFGRLFPAGNHLDADVQQSQFRARKGHHEADASGDPRQKPAGSLETADHYV